MPITGHREASLLQAVNTLLDARRTNTPIGDLSADLQPQSLEEVWFIQDNLAHSFGPVGGWKIGAPTPDATPGFAPMPAAWIAPGGSILAGRTHRYRGLEAEIAFLLASDIPPRAIPYTLDEIIPHLASCHPAIEILEPAYTDPDTVPKLAMIADLQMHGGFVFGPAYSDWQSVDFSQESVTLAVDGAVRVERTGSNTAGNLFRLLPFLANEGAARTGGLRAGQWITTGSWTGNIQGMPGSSVDARFSTVGGVTTRFA